MSGQSYKISSELFISNPTSLLTQWRQLRNKLTSSLTDIEHLQIVDKFWQHAPIQKYAINWDDPTNWPDPWQLMYSREFDDSSIALGMMYSLYLSFDQRWIADRLGLILINDKTKSLQKIVLDIDGRWLLNYEYATIVEKSAVQNRFFIQQKYVFDGKRHAMVS